MFVLFVFVIGTFGGLGFSAKGLGCDIWSYHCFNLLLSYLAVFVLVCSKSCVCVRACGRICVSLAR